VRLPSAAIGVGSWLLAGGLAGAAEPTPLYELPEAGSYELPVIDRVGAHELLDDSGVRAPVLGLEEGECAVVSFVYGGCPDATGCPLLLATLRRVDRALQQRDDLSGRVQLVSVSFDPARDTPERMKMLRTHMRPQGRWRFLTAENQAQLEPVLADFGQDAVALVSIEDGSDTGLIRHVAKVFLLDPQGGIRNVYSTGFLDDEILLLDIETLLQSEAAASD
jgi:cytochrome oxidase Cu insertion factor (SCO1/SenC/PrrC family)